MCVCVYRTGSGILAACVQGSIPANKIVFGHPLSIGRVRSNVLIIRVNKTGIYCLEPTENIQAHSDIRNSALRYQRAGPYHLTIVRLSMDIPNTYAICRPRNLASW